ncbi:matrixin family metalloprotease [Aquisalimonas sp.]|uniref:matrixin family metalloprotease n=1 Tax=Aquisalimonas sp. TaxID=1872621 RepID=UPI0025C008AC|nr:matrixin family metalloprotease [Aquisalimonas sp.]
MAETATKSGVALRLALACLLTAGAALAGPNDNSVDFRLLELDSHYVKWGGHTLGTGAEITYAVANETMRFEDTRNCGKLAPLDKLAARSNIAWATLEDEMKAAFRAWEAVADLTFTAMEDPTHANIVIGAQVHPTGRAFANVTYAPGSKNGVKVIDQALVCLNPEQPWKVGFDGNTDVYDIRYTLVHEIGHTIGLDHPGPSGEVMSFRYEEAFRDLQPGDIRGVTKLYGARTGRVAQH